MAVVVFLSGPPKAGKSRLRGDVHLLLRAGVLSTRRWFVEVLSPDGEGLWVTESWIRGLGHDAEALARRAKNAVKEAGQFFSPAFVTKKKAQLQGLLRWADLIIGDLGGVPSPENAEIISVATGHRIVPVVLTREGCDGSWPAFWRSQGLEPVIVAYHEALAPELLQSLLGVRAAAPSTLE